jgi:tetratricopeptide (TPR) repeat protein
VTLPDLEGLSREDARLRWVAADPAAVEAAAAEAEARLDDPEADRLRLLGYLGNAYRLLGRHTDAVAAHEQARDLAASAGVIRAYAVALVRLGESYRCADRFVEAEGVLRQALAVAPPGVGHFALQHLGKTLLDRGAAAEAEGVLDEALDRRLAAGDAALVRSTERALAAARSRR